MIKTISLTALIWRVMRIEEFRKTFEKLKKRFTKKRDQEWLTWEEMRHEGGKINLWIPWELENKKIQIARWFKIGGNIGRRCLKYRMRESRKGLSRKEDKFENVNLKNNLKTCYIEISTSLQSNKIHLYLSFVCKTTERFWCSVCFCWAIWKI